MLGDQVLVCTNGTSIDGTKCLKKGEQLLEIRVPEVDQQQYDLEKLFSWCTICKAGYTLIGLCFDMFARYFVRLRTNYYTLLTISPISFIFDSARNLIRNLPYCLL